MTILELYFSSNYYFSNNYPMNKNIINYIKSYYPFIKIDNISFDMEYSDLKIYTEFHNDYTKYVFINDIKRIERLHKIYDILNKDIVINFNRKQIELEFKLTK